MDFHVSYKSSIIYFELAASFVVRVFQGNIRITKGLFY